MMIQVPRSMAGKTHRTTGGFFSGTDRRRDCLTKKTDGLTKTDKRINDAYLILFNSAQTDFIDKDSDLTEKTWDFTTISPL